MVCLPGPSGIACESALRDAGHDQTTREREREVTVVLTNFVQRPWELPAACALVSERLTVATATVGYPAAGVAQAKGTALAPRHTTVQGINVPAGGFSAIDMGSVGGVRGEPPRGRPV